jgi:SAM-dependent methyltransferase
MKAPSVGRQKPTDSENKEIRMSLLQLQGNAFGHLSCLDASSTQRIWDKEYEQAPTIPSSHRSEPAHALVELTKGWDFPAKNALDLGCGNGRNAIFLASKGIHVTALDFSQFALNLLPATDLSSPAFNHIKKVKHDLSGGIPSSDSAFDLVLDSYCLCHFTEHEEQEFLMDEVFRALKPGGHFIKIHLDISDDYYLERLQTKTEYGHISFDPANGLQKMHCSIDSYTKKFAYKFALVKSVKVNFMDDVRGMAYQRSVFACLMQKV